MAASLQHQNLMGSSHSSSP